MSRRRVVVTGLGLISPVGNTVRAGLGQPDWPGRSGIATITQFDATAFACRFAGEVKDFKVEDYMPGQRSPAHGHLHPLRDGGVQSRPCRTPVCRPATR